MAPFKPPADATVIENSGLVSVYRMADGRILFVDETACTPFEVFGKFLKRMVLLSIFMLLTGVPMFVIQDIPSGLSWYYNGAIGALIALQIYRYRRQIRQWGRWKKQKFLYFDPGSKQWALGDSAGLSDYSSSALEVVCEPDVYPTMDPDKNHESQRWRDEWYYLYLRTAQDTNHLLLKTKTFKKARAVASLLEDEGMPGLKARGFTPPTRD